MVQQGCPQSHSGETRAKARWSEFLSCAEESNWYGYSCKYAICKVVLMQGPVLNMYSACLWMCRYQPAMQDLQGRQSSKQSFSLSFWPSQQILVWDPPRYFPIIIHVGGPVHFNNQCLGLQRPQIALKSSLSRGKKVLTSSKLPFPMCNLSDGFRKIRFAGSREWRG